MGKKNVIGIAKGTAKKTQKKPTKAKPMVKENVKSIEIVDDLIELADDKKLKVKRKIDEILKDIELEPKLKEKIMDIDTEHKDGIEWLEEQLNLSTELNDKLRSELGDARDDYKKIYEENQRLKSGDVSVVNESAVVNNIKNLFLEIQDNYYKMGFNQYGKSNLIISPHNFMERLVMFFPFLKELKKTK